VLVFGHAHLAALAAVEEEGFGLGGAHELLGVARAAAEFDQAGAGVVLAHEDGVGFHLGGTAL